MSTKQFTNSQGEVIDIIEVVRGAFKGSHILRIHDDPNVSSVIAIHLLDKETIAFLLEELPKL